MTSCWCSWVYPSHRRIVKLHLPRGLYADLRQRIFHCLDSFTSHFLRLICSSLGPEREQLKWLSFTACLFSSCRWLHASRAEVPINLFDRLSPHYRRSRILHAVNVSPCWTDAATHSGRSLSSVQLRLNSVRSWFQRLGLGAMGLWWSRLVNLFGDQEARILVLGLDNAGKTTILCELLTSIHRLIASCVSIRHQPISGSA